MPRESVGAVELSLDRRIQQAAAAYNRGEFLKASGEFKKIADGGDIEGYLNSAVILKDLCHYRMAINILKAASLKFEDSSRVLSFLGRLYYLNGQPDEAIAVLNKALKFMPDDKEVYITLGLCYEDTGDDLHAQEYYEKSISFDKNNVAARLSLADLYNRRNMTGKAIDEYKAAGSVDTSIVKIHKILAELFFKIGNLTESLKAYRKIVSIEPGNKPAQKRVDEISVKIGKEFFEREREKVDLRRKRPALLVKPFSWVKNIIPVRVGLMQGEKSIEFKCSTPFEIQSKVGNASIAIGPGNESCLAAIGADGIIVVTIQDIRSIIGKGPVIIAPLELEGTMTLFNVKFGKDNFWSGQRDLSYRGRIEISAGAGGIDVVNIINLEEYLYGVVPSEMPSDWPKEALCAQAVAARTEAMSKIGRHRDEGFDFCSGVHCQSYGGAEREKEATNRAVDETRGLIAFYQGKPADFIYSSNCGGHTQDNIFGSAEPVYYLKGRLDSLGNKDLIFPLSPVELEYWLKEPRKGILCDTSGHANASNFRWARIYTAQEMENMLSKIAGFGRIKKITVLRRNKSGHVSAIKITGVNVARVIEKELNIRNSLGGLRSAMFKLEIKYGRSGEPRLFIFYGGGWGHGVGMCQSGAYGLADLGKDYKEILSYYFQGIELKKMY